MFKGEKFRLNLWNRKRSSAEGLFFFFSQNISGGKEGIFHLNIISMDEKDVSGKLVRIVEKKLNFLYKSVKNTQLSSDHMALVTVDTWIITLNGQLLKS